MRSATTYFGCLSAFRALGDCCGGLKVQPPVAWPVQPPAPMLISLFTRCPYKLRLASTPRLDFSHGCLSSLLLHPFLLLLDRGGRRRAIPESLPRTADRQTTRAQGTTGLLRMRARVAKP